MTERREAVRGPARATLPRRRKRWLVVGGVAAFWVVLLVATGSALYATVLLAVIAGLGAACVLGLRGMGVTRDHPLVRRMAARPWRDGQDVLQQALRHLSEVFVVTPSGSLLAPNVVDLHLNPDDLRSLCERMELGLISASAAEVYEDQVAAHGARFAGPGPADVRVIADPSVPAGRYRLRQGEPVNADAEPGFQFAPSGPEPMYPRPELEYAVPLHAYAAPGPMHGAGPGPMHDDGPPYQDLAADGITRAQPDPGATFTNGVPTVMEQKLAPVPILRLVTGDSVAETRMSGARAGRGAVELGLPQVPTVSREHARFTFSDGQWWVANLGMNGLTVNGVPLTGEHPLSNDDVIRWGTRPDALLSRVEIG